MIVKPFFALFVTNAVCADKWDKYANADPEIDILGQVVMLAEKKPENKKKLPLKNKYALFLYNRSIAYLDEKFEAENGHIADVKKYVQKRGRKR